MQRQQLSLAATVIAAMLFLSMVLPAFAYVTTALRQSDVETRLPVTTLSELPGDGTPLGRFVRQPFRNGWVKYDSRIVDFVFVRRHPQTNDVMAFHPNVYLLTVRYVPTLKKFRTNCWGGILYDLDGHEEGDRAIGDLIRLPLNVVGDDVFVDRRLE